MIHQPRSPVPFRNSLFLLLLSTSIGGISGCGQEPDSEGPSFEFICLPWSAPDAEASPENVIIPEPEPPANPDIVALWVGDIDVRAGGVGLPGGPRTLQWSSNGTDSCAFEHSYLPTSPQLRGLPPSGQVIVDWLDRGAYTLTCSGETSTTLGFQVEPHWQGLTIALEADGEALEVMPNGTTPELRFSTGTPLTLVVHQAANSGGSVTGGQVVCDVTYPLSAEDAYYSTTVHAGAAPLRVEFEASAAAPSISLTCIGAQGEGGFATFGLPQVPSPEMHVEVLGSAFLEVGSTMTTHVFDAQATSVLRWPQAEGVACSVVSFGDVEILASHPGLFVAQRGLDVALDVEVACVTNPDIGAPEEFVQVVSIRFVDDED